ncbi:hypothetical protein Tco_1170073, partial [Tanacetum coccineum]
VSLEQFDAFTSQLATLTLELQTTKASCWTRHGAGSNDHGIPRSIRFDVPKFNGTDPDSWIFAINEYFSLLETTPEQRLCIIGFNLEGDAAMVLLDDTQQDSHKLGWVSRKSEFEKLRNRVTDVTESLLISFYISGLEPALQRELLVSKPTP